MTGEKLCAVNKSAPGMDKKEIPRPEKSITGEVSDRCEAAIPAITRMVKTTIPHCEILPLETWNKSMRYRPGVVSTQMKRMRTKANVLIRSDALILLLKKNKTKRIKRIVPIPKSIFRAFSK